MKGFVIAFVVALIVGVSLGQNLPLLSNIFGDHMVLQRAPEPANIFGWTKTIGEQVTVMIQNQIIKTTSSSEYYWSVNLIYNAGGPYNISISSANSGQTILTDVYFGDVYICSGQSNMQFTVSSAFNASAEIAAAGKYNLIRVFTVGENSISYVPLPQLATIEQPWAVASPQSIGAGDWTMFSAVCWFAGRDLFDQIQVPLGLISPNWGGTIIQAWSSPSDLKKCNQTKYQEMFSSNTNPVSSQDEKTNEDSSLNLKANPNQPSVLYNAMIYPLANVSIRGVIWYQAEQNIGQAEYYACAFPVMIETWKNLFNPVAIPFTFFFVQIAAFTDGGGYNLAAIRQSQLTGLELDYVAFATAVDLGDLGSPYGNVHPRNKQTVGARLAKAILTLSYGQKGIQWQGPMAESFVVTSPAPNIQLVTVSFVNGTVGKGLMSVDTKCPDSLVGTGECGWYEIGTSDGAWHTPVQVSVGTDTVTMGVTVSPGLKVTGTRYGYADWPVCTLYNMDGLPAIPWNL